jgi:hypothetical protein
MAQNVTQKLIVGRSKLMRVGIASEHAGFTLKKQLSKALRESAHQLWKE